MYDHYFNKIKYELKMYWKAIKVAFNLDDPRKLDPLENFEKCDEEGG